MHFVPRTLLLLETMPADKGFVEENAIMASGRNDLQVAGLSELGKARSSEDHRLTTERIAERFFRALEQVNPDRKVRSRGKRGS